MIVLKIIGWVLLGLLALIILALCVRVKLYFEYSSENTSVLLKYLFLKIPIFPTKKKSSDDESKNDSSEDKPIEDEPIEADVPKVPEEKTNLSGLLKTFYQAEGTDGLMLLAQRTGSYLKTFFGGLIRAFTLDELELDACCAKGDAAQTAIYYGEVCSSLFPVLGSLAAKNKLKQYDINVYPDYLARFSSASFYMCMSFCPIRILGGVIALAVKFVFKVILQIIVKIFLLSKGKGKTAENENKKNIKEKSEATNE